jgi:hypothetical protein
MHRIGEFAQAPVVRGQALQRAVAGQQAAHLGR